MTQRIEPYSKYYSKNWTLFNIWLEELNIFFNRTFSIWLKGFNFFSICFEELNPFLIWPKELTFFGKMSQIFEPFFNMTQRIVFFILFQWLSLILKLAHRIDFLKVILRIDFYFIVEKKTHRIERIEPFLVITQRIEFFCGKYDSKNWTFFSQFDSIVPSFFHDSNTWTFFTWLKELNFLFLRDSNTWTFFEYIFQRNGPFFFRTQSFFIKKKHRFFFFESDPQNCFFLWIEPFNFLNMTQRFEAFFQNITQRIGFFIRLKELNFLMNMTQRTKLFLKVWLKELNSFWKCDSKNWTLFGSMPQRIELFLEVCLKELNSFKNMTQRFFREKFVTQRIETFFLWL